MVCLKTLLSKLEHYGIRGSALTLIRSFLKRQQFVMLNEKSSKTLPNDFGVPQGSMLGPLLFLYSYVNDMANAVQNTSRLFADVTCLLISHCSISTLQDNFNTEVKKSLRLVHS